MLSDSQEPVWTAASDNSDVVESDVTVTTADGDCDAAFFYLHSGSHPGVVMWPDAFGLRPAIKSLAKRLAAEGYSVLVPNPFYRLTKAPFTDASAFRFSSADDMAKVRPLLLSANVPGHAETDGAAFVAFLDAQAQVSKGRKMGTQGYCMGGAQALRAASVSNRIGAVASLHGGSLVTDKPDSPHLLAPKIRASVYIGIASDDDARQADAKDMLKDAFEAAGDPVEVEVYPDAAHGWCIPDMPARNGTPIYNERSAERAWAKLLLLYRRALA